MHPLRFLLSDPSLIVERAGQEMMQRELNFRSGKKRVYRLRRGIRAYGDDGIRSCELFDVYRRLFYVGTKFNSPKSHDGGVKW